MQLSQETREAIDMLYKYLESLEQFHDIEFKESLLDYFPFKKMKVNIKKEIVTFKMDKLNMLKTGKYLNSDSWDEIIEDENTIVVDTRNDYEVAMGTFKNSVNPQTENFSDFPEWAQKNLKSPEQKVAMFCTGGVRCEKSTAYLKKLGFKNVYHLKGGIIQYLIDKKGKKSMWEGNCFVFDDRYAIDSNLNPIKNS